MSWPTSSCPHPGTSGSPRRTGFAPDFCEAADPESKGVVEHLVGYAKSDLVVPAGGWPNLETANRDAATWCGEVNGRRHADIAAVPAERLAIERPLLHPLPSLRPASPPTATRKVDSLSTVRFGSARYSVPAGLRGQRLELTVEGSQLTISRRGIPVARHRLVGPG